jgi:hypothetical protein
MPLHVPRNQRASLKMDVSLLDNPLQIIIGTYMNECILDCMVVMEL